VSTTITETLYEPIGDVIRTDLQRELPVKLSDFERLAIADAKAVVESEIEQEHARYAESEREWARRFDALESRRSTLSAELRSREQVRPVLCYERLKGGQVELVRRDLDPRDPDSVVERRAASLGEAQRTQPGAPAAAEPAPLEPAVDRKRKVKRP
jgi:hypothetical protein